MRSTQATALKVKLPSYHFLPTASNIQHSSSSRSLFMIMTRFYVILTASVLGALASDKPGASICYDKNEPNGLCADNDVGRVLHRGLAAACNPTDRDGSPLESSGLTADGLLACHYHGSSCTYSAHGEFSTGPGTCPLAAEPTEGPSILPDDQEDCHLAHDNSGILMSNEPAAGFLACGSGGPYPASFQFETDPVIAGNVKKPFPITAACPSADKKGGALLSSSMTKDGFIACKYAYAYCTYFTNGDFSSGSSICPSSADHVEPENEIPQLAPGCSVTGTDGATLISQGCKGISPECTYVMACCIASFATEKTDMSV